MFDDSDDFAEPTTRKTAAASTSKGLKRTKAAKGEPSSQLILVHPKWETASFVTKLRTLLQDQPSGSYKLQFKPEVASPCRPSPRGGTSSVLSNVSLNTSVSGDLQLDLEADDLSVLILTEPEYVGSGNNLYKRRLAKLVTSKTTSPVHSVVVVVRSARTPPQDFLSVQVFCTIELGLALIPINDNLDKHLPQLLVQLLASRKKKKNPYKLGLPRQQQSKTGPLSTILATLATVPGLSESKAKDLVSRFGSVQDIATAQVSDLTPVVGKSTATSVHHFFRLEQQ